MKEIDGIPWWVLVGVPIAGPPAGMLLLQWWMFCASFFQW